MLPQKVPQDLILRLPVLHLSNNTRQCIVYILVINLQLTQHFLKKDEMAVTNSGVFIFW